MKLLRFNRCLTFALLLFPLLSRTEYRSQGRDKARELVGTVGHVNLYDAPGFYGTFMAVPEYTHSFRPQQIARCLFGDKCVNDGRTTINIQGSQVENRDACAWLADYFYLPTDFSGSISFKPTIQNFLVNLDLYLGLDEYVCGAWFRIYGPVTYTKWDLDFCECTPVSTGTNNHTAGYFSPSELPRDNLLENFSSYASGCHTVGNFEGIVFQPLKYGKINCDSRSRTGFADLRMELGWNFLLCPDYHLGLALIGAAPTGNRYEGDFLFNPVVGNGHHWELGANVGAHYILWQCSDDEHLGVYFSADITHMFATRLQRTYDLCNKRNSKYMLAERMAAPVTNLSASSQQQTDATSTSHPNIVPAAQFQNEYAPVANLTTIDARVSIPIQADVVVMLNYSSCNWSVDLGYNFWSISCEKISCPRPCNGFCCPVTLCDLTQENQWALKGDARVFGFTQASLNEGVIPADTAVALSATQSQATICTGTNAVNSGDNASLLNLGVDNPAFALGISGSQTTPLLAVAGDTATPIRTSLEPIFINCENIDFQPRRGLSHKVFGHVSYNWWDHGCYIPYLGVGGFAEFGQSKDTNVNPACARPGVVNTLICNNACNTECNTNCGINCDPCTDTCLSCPLSQWGIWIKGGVSF